MCLVPFSGKGIRLDRQHAGPADRGDDEDRTKGPGGPKRDRGHRLLWYN